MAESMNLPAFAPEPGRRPAARKPRIPHPHLKAPAERMLRAALRIGLALNAATLVIPRLVPVDWRYGVSDFLLAGAVLLSGYALLAVGRLRQPPS